MGMRLEIDMPEHHYNNIMAFDSVNLGRVPYKGIIMYAINAIKHGKVLDQEPTDKNFTKADIDAIVKAINAGWELRVNETTKNDLAVDCISRDVVKNYIQAHIHEIITESGEDKNKHTNRVLRSMIHGVNCMPSVTPQSKTGHWIKISPANIYECSECGQNVMTQDICAYKFCHGCGAKMVEPQESEGTE